MAKEPNPPPSWEERAKAMLEMIGKTPLFLATERQQWFAKAKEIFNAPTAKKLREKLAEL